MSGRILFGAVHSVIEPLGLLHLAGLARDMGWERRFRLIKDHDYREFFDVVADFRPDVVGFNVYTGSHLPVFAALQRLRRDYPGIRTVLGGPHATYFPREASRSADFVVMSEGFGGLRQILRGEARPGVLPMTAPERFPQPDRAAFYQDYPGHAQSPIKSVITMTGCPYSCTYCYNSSTASDIQQQLSPDVADQIGRLMGASGRLFPHNVRTVDDVIIEARELVEHWPTKLVYCQDDVHGVDTKVWMPEFARRWPTEIGVPYHAQMRWEMTRSELRLDLLAGAGCSGLTLAIEAADPTIRAEVLHREMPDEVVTSGMRAVVSRGLKVRTEQITGLPYGATTITTPMNLDADLALVELNVRLRSETGGPTMAWASTFVPYAGTKLGVYTTRYGHFDAQGNDEIHDTFFERSILRFPQEWVGPELEDHKNDPAVWLSDGELETYHDRNQELRRLFNVFTLIPEGHVLARDYLTDAAPFGYERLGMAIEQHLHRVGARETLETLAALREDAALGPLAPYFACLPGSRDAVIRYRNYAHLGKEALATATRHHLYDTVLYEVG